MIFIGRFGEGLEHLALQHLDLLLRRLQLLLAEARQLETALVGGERFLKFSISWTCSSFCRTQASACPPRYGEQMGTLLEQSWLQRVNDSWSSSPMLQDEK